MSTAVSFPVQVLREHLTGLEAAISVCLADPSQKPVHKLRTETRRIEALLLLIALVPGLPEHRKAAASFLRSLAKLRRAAGTVRDLDVHRKMLETLAEGDLSGESSGSGTAAGMDRESRRAGRKTKAKATSKRKSAAPDDAALNGSPARDIPDLSKPARQLRKHMGSEREKAAAALQQLLEERQPKTAKAAEQLLKLLEPAADLALPATDLLRDAESVLTREGSLQPEHLATATKHDLHAIRKAAKAARYVAESVSGDPAAEQAARGFEALQEAGGQWHDALELAHAARRYFGRDHQLTARYREDRERKLATYRAALSARAGEPAPAQRKSGRKASAKRRPAD